MDAQLDKFGALVSQSKVSVAILGTPALDSFELVDLEAISIERLAVLGMELVGIIGMVPDRDSVVRLTPRVALAVELDAATEAMLTERFVRLMQKAITLIETDYLPKLRMEAN
jgi:hypothetical protein